jgi:hypothetical protein
MTQPGLSLEGFTVGLVDAGRLKVVESPGRWDTWTLLDCIAEDPQTWDDLCLLWPRYAAGSPAVATLGQFPFEDVSRDELMRRLRSAPAWLVVDLQSRCLMAAGRLPGREPMGLHAASPWSPAPTRAATAPAADGCAQQSLWAGVPGWWSVQDQTDLDRLWAPKPVSAERPAANRELLWGEAMLQSVARMQIELAGGISRWSDYRLQLQEVWTREVHRRWLMQPCGELGGRAPRTCIVGGDAWIDQLSTRQLIRMGHGDPVVPLSTRLSTYADAPFGPLELQAYFHACRHTIQSGWNWLSERLSAGDAARLEERLTASLRQALGGWLEAERPDRPAAVRDVIAIERLRVPVLAEFDDPSEPEWGAACHLVAPGTIGSILVGSDLAELEVEGEFAFSRFVTRQQWEAEHQIGAVATQRAAVASWHRHPGPPASVGGSTNRCR